MGGLGAVADIFANALISKLVLLDGGGGVSVGCTSSEVVGAVLAVGTPTLFCIGVALTVFTCDASLPTDCSEVVSTTSSSAATTDPGSARTVVVGGGAMGNAAD